MQLRRNLVALGLVSLVGVAVAGRDHLHERLQCLNITLRLNDDSFCPGGRMTGREGRQEGRDDRISAWIVARTTGGQRFRIRSGENARGQVSIFRYDKQSGKVGKRVRGGTFPVRGVFTGNGRTIFCARFKPPTEPGDYVIRASLGGSTVDSTPIGVWYDRAACPRPGGHQPPHPPGPPQPPPPPPSPQPPPVSGDMAKCLAVTLNVSWNCADGSGNAQVTVRNTNHAASIPVDGIGSRNIGRLSGFSRVSGPAVLGPGQTAVFRASGSIPDGSRKMEAWVSNLPAARDSSDECVECGPNYNDLH